MGSRWMCFHECCGMLLLWQVDCVFMVEIEQKKREFLKQFKPRYLFKDMAEMGRKRAETHEGDFPEVPKAG